MSSTASSVDQEVSFKHLTIGPRTKTRIKMTTQAGDSSFLSLPAELRNAIYQYYCAGQDTLIIESKQGPLPPALAMVSHQTREEFMSIYRKVRPRWYSKTVSVEIQVQDLDFEPFQNFVRFVGQRTEQPTALEKVHTILMFSDPTTTPIWYWLSLASQWNVLAGSCALLGKEARTVTSTYTAEFDWDKFDVETASRHLESVRLSFGYYDKYLHSAFPQLQAAVREAVTRRKWKLLEEFKAKRSRGVARGQRGENRGEGNKVSRRWAAEFLRARTMSSD